MQYNRLIPQQLAYIERRLFIFEVPGQELIFDISAVILCWQPGENALLYPNVV